MCITHDPPIPLFGVFAGETCSCAQERVWWRFCDSEKLDKINALIRSWRRGLWERDFWGDWMGEGKGRSAVDGEPDEGMMGSGSRGLGS